MIKKIILCAFVMLSGGMSFGQSYFSRWQYTWGGNRQDFSGSMIALPGNKYFFAGTAASDVSCNKTSTLYGDEDFAVSIFDDNGNELWEKTYGGAQLDQLSSAIKVASGGYLLTGTTQSGPSGTKTSTFYGGTDFWVVRLDDNGNQLWENTYGGTDIEGGTKIVATPDGGFLIGGLSLSNTPGYNFGVSDYQLLKIDANGNLVWSKLYGGTGNDELADLIPTTDGNYLLSGTSSSPISGNKTSAPLGNSDIWLVKVTGDGTKLWDKSFGTTDGDFSGTLLALKDGKILITESSVNTGRIRKIDNNGNQIWLQTCVGNNQDFFNVATEDTATGKIYVAGTSKSDNAGCKTSPYNGGGWFGDIWIAIFDSSGNKVDDLDYGGNDADIPTDIHVINDEIWVYAWSDSPLSGNKTTDNCGQTADWWILRLAKKFYINSKTPTAVCLNQKNLQVYVTANNNFATGNIFTVQLSDSAGSFASPVTIGTVAATTTDSVATIIPSGLPYGQGYKLRVVASAPADTTALYPFWLYGLPTVNLGRDTTICANTTLNLNPGPQPNGSVYQWQDGTRTNNYTATTGGLYWCAVQNGCGTSRDSILVQIKQKPLCNIGPDSAFCAGKSVILQNIPQPPDVTYLWNTGALTNTIPINQGGVYWLGATNSCGTTYDTLVATENPLPKVTLDKSSIICGPNRVLDAGSGFAGYLWNTGANTATITVSTTGTYWVTVQDVNACVGSDTVAITKVAALPANFLPGDTTICSYDNLAVSALTPFSSYVWSTGAVTRSVVLQSAGNYWLQVTNQYGCVGKDSLQLSFKECPEGFYVPTAFTPNNDGKNDFFHPYVYGKLIQYHFAVYNRWGQLVFDANNPDKAWDGTFNNAAADPGVYVWVCTVQLAGKEKATKNGSVVLVR